MKKTYVIDTNILIQAPHAFLCFEENDVVRMLEQFPVVLKAALNKSEPSMVTRYSVDLAQAFNKFYYEHKVMVDDLGARSARIHLTRAVKQTIAKALELIGLEAPERM